MGSGQGSRLTDYTLLAVIAVSVSTAPIFVLLSDAPGVAAATWRLIISAALMLTSWTLLERGKRPSRMAVPLSAVSGALLAIHFDAWMTSLYIIPVGVSTSIVDSYPALVILLGSRTLGEHYSARHLVGATLAMVGAMALSLADPGTTYLKGTALAALGMVAMAGYVVLGRSVRRSTGLATYTAIAYSSGALVSAAIALSLGVPLLGYGLRSWECFLALALVPMLGGHTVMNYLLARRSSLASSIAVLAEPVGSSLLAYAVLGQGLGAQQVALMAVVLLGVTMVVA